MASHRKTFWEVLTILYLLASLATAQVHPTEAVISNDKDNNDEDFSATYNEILKDLREHWQSPIMYLKKRGYLPDLKTVLQPRTVLNNHTADLCKQFISNFINKVSLISSIIDQNENSENIDDLASEELLADVPDKYASLFPVAAVNTNEKSKVIHNVMNSNELPESAAQITTNDLNQLLQDCTLSSESSKL